MVGFAVGEGKGLAEGDIRIGAVGVAEGYIKIGVVGVAIGIYVGEGKGEEVGVKVGVDVILGNTVGMLVAVQPKLRMIVGPVKLRCSRDPSPPRSSSPTVINTF